MKKWIALILILTSLMHVAQAYGPCGNGQTGGPGGDGSETPSPKPKRKVKPIPETKKGDPLLPYSGNEFREIAELPLWGSTGSMPMVWARYGNSRTIPGSSLFGMGHYWRHNFQWEIVKTSNDSLGRAQMQVIYPNGAYFNFSQISATQWSPNGTVSDQLIPSGNDFILQRADATRYHFKQYVSGTTVYYLMTDITDDSGNIFTLEYNTAHQVTKVMEPAGRFFTATYTTLSANKIDFSTLSTLATTPVSGQWTELTSTSTTAFRYVRLLVADGSFGNISEAEFYDNLGNKLTGTVISSDALAQANNAFDGNPATGFVSAAKSGSYIGLDLGATPKKIGKIRFLTVTGQEALQKPAQWGFSATRLQAANQAPVSVTAISKVETSDGRSLTYNYTNLNDAMLPYLFPTLTSVSYGDGTTTNYQYGQAFPGQRPLVVEWDDARYGMPQNHYKTVYQNDRASAALGMVDYQVNVETGNKIIQIGIYNNNLHTPTVTFADGAVERQEMNYPTGRNTIAMTGEYDAMGNKATYTYGSEGYMTTETDPLGRKFSYVWTIAGNPLSITYPDNGVETWTRNSLDSVLSHKDALGRVVTFTRDARNRITRVDYPDSSYETFVYNSFSEITQKRQRNGALQNYTYDARGLLTQCTDALGNITKFGYDANDRVAAVTDARGNTTTTTYNERGLVMKLTHSDGSFQSYTYDKYGSILTKSNELGNTSRYVYDIFRRMTEMTDELGRVSKVTYPSDVYDNKPVESILPSGKKTTFTYDKNWNVLKTTVAEGASDAATMTFVYDKMNNLIQTTDAKGKVAQMTYDLRNRLLTQKDPLGNVTSCTYDLVGNLLTTTDALGRVTTNTYDLMNRLVTTTDAKSQKTSYFYDLSGNMIKMVDAKNNVYQNTFDLLNRKTAMIYPDNSKEQYIYDAVSNVTQYTTRAGQIKTSLFDNRNREISFAWSDGTAGVTRTFDVMSRLLTSNNGVSAITYTYNVANELLTEKTVVGTNTRTLTYAYNIDGNLTSVTYPGGNIVSYDYTNRNQVSAIYEDGGVPMAIYSYDLNGNRIGKTLENGTATTYGYDDDSRLTSIADKKGTTTLYSTTYTLNAVGNRTAKVQDGKTENYSFDAINQVAGVDYKTGTTVNRSVSYGYDATGNRTSVVDNGVSTAYQSNSLNAYTSVGGAAMVNDLNGNLTNGGTIQSGLFFYDAQNRLTKATVGANTTEFAYDSKNRCVKRTLNGVATYLVYNGWSLIEERNASGTILARYAHGVGADEILAKTTTTGAIYYHRDGLASTTFLSDASGNLIEKYSYDIFGKATIFNSQLSILNSSSYENRFLFTGREFLRDVGLYDYRNRVYSENLGRFLQTDPMSFSAGDVNLYGYCGNGPTSANDPSGLKMISTTAGHTIQDLFPKLKVLGEGSIEATLRAHHPDIFKVRDEMMSRTTYAEMLTCRGRGLDKKIGFSLQDVYGGDSAGWAGGGPHSVSNWYDANGVDLWNGGYYDRSFYNPVQWTLGLGVTGSGGAFMQEGGSFGGYFGYNQYTGWSGDFLGSGQAAGSLGSGFSIGVFVQYTNASNVSDLAGSSNVYGGSAGVFSRWGGDYVQGSNYSGIQINNTWGWGTPEVHAGKSYTK